jgi:hypothetical protein
MASPSASASLMARWETSGAASWSRTIVSRPDFANRCKLSAVMAPLSSASMTSTSRCRLEYETRLSDHVGTGHNDRAHRPLINEAPEVVDGAVATNQRRQPTCRL